jgi:hypothetical protein
MVFCEQDVEEKKRNKKKDKKKRKGKRADEKDPPGCTTGSTEDNFPAHVDASQADKCDTAQSDPSPEPTQAACSRAAPRGAHPNATPATDEGQSGDNVVDSGKPHAASNKQPAQPLSASGAAGTGRGRTNAKSSKAQRQALQKQAVDCQDSSIPCASDQADHSEASEWQSVASAARKARNRSAAKPVSLPASHAAPAPGPGPGPQQKPPAPASKALAKPSHAQADQRLAAPVPARQQAPATAARKAPAKGKNGVIPAIPSAAQPAQSRQSTDQLPVSATAAARLSAASFADVARPAQKMREANTLHAKPSATAAVQMPKSEVRQGGRAVDTAGQATAPAQKPSCRLPDAQQALHAIASVAANHGGWGQPQASSSSSQAAGKHVQQEQVLQQLDTPVAPAALPRGQPPIGKAEAAHRVAALVEPEPVPGAHVLRVGPQACTSHTSSLPASTASSWSQRATMRPSGTPAHLLKFGSLPLPSATAADHQPADNSAVLPGINSRALRAHLELSLQKQPLRSAGASTSLPTGAAPGWPACIAAQRVDWSFPRSASGTSLSSIAAVKPKVSPWVTLLIKLLAGAPTVAL